MRRTGDVKQWARKYPMFEAELLLEGEVGAE